MSVVFPINENDRFEQYTLTGGQTIVALPFPFQDNRDITLVRISLLGVKTVLAEPADYALTGAGFPAGGTITLVTAATAGEKLQVYGLAVLDRLTSIVRGGTFSSDAIDKDLDRNRLVQQEQARDIGRALKVALGSVGGELKPGTPGQIVGYDSGGDLHPVEISPNLTAVTPFMLGLNGDADTADELLSLAGGLATGIALFKTSTALAGRTVLDVYSKAEVYTKAETDARDLVDPNGPRNPIVYKSATQIAIAHQPRLSMGGFRYKGRFKKSPVKTFAAPAPTAPAEHVIGWGNGSSTQGDLAYESVSTAKTWYCVMACANDGDATAVFKVVPFMRVASITGSVITIAATGENELYNYPAWAGNTAYTVGQRVVNGSFVYECTTGGTTATATSFAASAGPVAIGSGIADGTVVWASVGTATLPPAWAISTVYALNKVVTNGGNIYICTTAGTSAGAGGPSGTGTGIADNTAVWSYVGAVANQPVFRQKEHQIANNALIGCEVLVINETIASRKKAFSGRVTSVTANNKAGASVTVPGAYIGSAPLAIFPNQITLADIGTMGQGDWFLVAPNYQNYEYIGCFYTETSGTLGAPSAIAELRNLADTGTEVQSRGGGVLCPQLFTDPADTGNWTASTPRQATFHGDLSGIGGTPPGIDMWCDTHISPLALGICFRHTDTMWTTGTGSDAIEYGMDNVHETIREVTYKDAAVSRSLVLTTPMVGFSFHPRLHFQSAAAIGATTIRALIIQGWIEP